MNSDKNYICQGECGGICHSCYDKEIEEEKQKIKK